MRVGVTGATGFLGRYIVRLLVTRGHRCVAWFRPGSDRSGFDDLAHALDWIPGELGDAQANRALVSGCDAIVHAALYRPGAGFRGAEGDLITFVERNVVGTLALVEAARAAGVPRFVDISSCAVHERILNDRPLDETHPLWPVSHYGAHKAAIEAFVHSYGLGEGYAICAVRPTGIYGLAHPPRESKWYDLVQSVVRGEPVRVSGGGKEVHAADVARAVELLLQAETRRIAGQAFNCYDMYVANADVATIARDVAQSTSPIEAQPAAPRNQIDTQKVRALGMTFGGRERLVQTISELIGAIRQ